jgi:membrane-bound lytic murein transglycosylase B
MRQIYRLTPARPDRGRDRDATRPAGRSGRLAVVLAGALATLAPAVRVPAATEPPGWREGVEQLIAEMERDHGFDRSELEAILKRAHFRPRILEAMDRPYEAMPWYRYRGLFVTPELVDAGVAYWKAHAADLARAEATYGVSPEILVAVLGVETAYGAQTGTQRALDALATLAFCYAKRSDFFRGELKSLLVLAREEGIDPLTVKGSYAGALGKPQFIPSSYRTFAVDFDGDGRRDLWHSDADAIGSVANYFRKHGWQPGGPVAVPLSLPGGWPAGLDAADRQPAEPSIPLGRLRESGAILDGDLGVDTPVALIRLEGPSDEYWAGFANFYAITRYNRSNLYAMAVYRLGQEIRARYERAS